ncbi:MAG: 5'/3'-nucleotidase SurE [Bacteroidaceae bacterium]|nr:5'/3'-nucleotidase SurE [Bacteroidaceae bacterium]
MKQRPFLLLSNDDGYAAKGIAALIDTLRPLCDLLVVAPDGARSGMSMAMTTSVPVTLRLVRKERGLKVYACSGTPTDCVKLAVAQLVKGRRPDLVVSGINHGDNSSVNSHYSGTMGAAYEGVMHGIPAVAFSLCDFDPDADFSPLRPYLIDIVFKAIAAGLPPMTCLNVNFPNVAPYKGVRVCRMARTHWENEFARTRRPNTGSYVYWLTGDRVDDEPQADDTDAWALAHGYVAVTPETLDVTAHGLVEVLKGSF